MILTLRRRGGAFVTRYYWRDAPPSIRMLAPMPPPRMAEPDQLEELPTVLYNRGAQVARNHYVYTEEG